MVASITGRSRKAVALVSVLVLGLSACGSRLSHARLLADARSTTANSQGSEPAAGNEGSGNLAAAGAASDTAGATGAGPDAVTSGGTSGGAKASGAAGSTAAANSTSGGAACTGSKTPIVIGTVGEQSGIAGAAVGDGPKAVAAWATMVNAEGGLDCHHVKYIVLDDGADPARNQALTQQLVEEDHAIALVQTDAPLAMQGSYAYLNQKQIPVIGSEGAEDFFYQSPYFFPQHSSGSEMIYSVFAGFATGLSPAQKAHLGMLNCLEAQQCSLNAQQGPGDAQQLGMSVVYSARASLTQPDFTSECTAAKAAGVQTFFLSMDANSIHRIARSCLSVNFRPVYTTGVSVLVPDLDSDPNIDGLLGGVAVKPWMVSSDPGVAAYQATLRRFAPGLTFDNAGMEGWVSAQLFAAAAKNLPDPPTSQAVLQGLWTIKNNDLGGLTQPLTFTQGQNAPRIRCWFIAETKAGGWVSPNGGARGCK